MDQINEKKKATMKQDIKQKKIILIALISLILVTIVGWVWYTLIYGSINVDDAYIDREKASISSKTLGRISKILVNEGDVITKNQPLIILDTAELSVQRKQAEASLAYAQENANLARINSDRAEDDFKRIEKIYQTNNISYSEYIHAKKAFEAAQESYKMAQKQIDVASAQLELINSNITNATIVTAFNGVVSKKWVIEGDVVQPGQPILSVNSTDAVWVIANFEETNLSYLRNGKEAEISIDAYRNLKFKGKILQIGTSTASQFSLIPPNNASGNFTKITQRVPVKISIEPIKPLSTGNAILLPGMSAVVRVKKG